MTLVGSEDNLDVDGEVKFADWEGVRKRVFWKETLGRFDRVSA
jgi:hypothetical protein